MKHIQAYWVDGKANFGDSVTPELIEFLTGRPVAHADKWHTEILTIGSLLGWALLKNRSKGTAGRIDAARMLIRRFISKPVLYSAPGFFLIRRTIPLNPFFAALRVFSPFADG